MTDQTQYNITRRLRNLITVSDDYARNEPDPLDREFHLAKAMAYRHALFLVIEEFRREQKGGM